MFCSFHFSFFVFCHENTKILHNLCLHILQGKMDKTGKNQKENHATKVTKVPKDENMGQTKHL